MPVRERQFINGCKKFKKRGMALEQSKLRPVAAIRIFREEKCFGPGVAELLERVGEQRSLRQAAAGMGMSYSKAWSIVKNAEAGLDMKLLTSCTGGAGGGGACLTAEAQKLLADYRAFEGECKRAVAEAFDRHFSDYK